MAAPRCRNCGGKKWSKAGRCVECREFPTLGWNAADWIEDRCAIPDRDQVGEPFILTHEQIRFLLHFYRINPRAKWDGVRQRWRGAFFYERGAQLTRPQKWGKGPFSGTIVCVEAAGPVVFDGWDADGQPVGRPWATPYIQITASSEDQTDNVWMALLPMIQLGDFAAEIPETGKQRIYLPGGGMIEPVTSAARSRLGQRVTLLNQDQTESWTETNGGRALADNQRRNVAGMGGRWVSQCNGWDPTEESVAQYTAEEEVKEGGVFIDDVEPPEELDIRKKTQRRKALEVVYGDSAAGSFDAKGKLVVRPWIDLDRLDSEIRALLKRDPAQAERFYLNRKEAKAAKAFRGWPKLKKPKRVIPKGELITIGIDGARFNDALAMIATDVVTGHQWPLGIWERPKDAGPDYEHPFEEMDEVLLDAMGMPGRRGQWQVWRVYIDPGSSTGNIDTYVEKWQGRWGEKRIHPWYMHRPRQTAFAVANYADAIANGDLTHDGDKTFARHIRNAVRRKVTVKDEEGRELYVLSKDRHDSPRKIDAASAGVLSWEARGDAIAAGAKKRKRARIRGFN